MSSSQSPSAGAIADALQLIEPAEGWVPVVYNDPYGIPTIGYGTALVIKNQTGAYQSLDKPTLYKGYGDTIHNLR